MWCIPEPGPAYVAAMEDVLDVYHRPYDPHQPVVCLDETSRQLLSEVRSPLPPRPGQPARHDPAYGRGGVVNCFLVTEPLRGWRSVIVSARRTRQDFAWCLKELLDEHYPTATRVVLVLDNLNIHAPESLYATFPPAEARRLCQRLEWHYTPKHGSWLNMAELELSVLSRQCLDRRVATSAALAQAVAAWVDQRNAVATPITWQFTTADARTRLRRLYPCI